MTALDILAGGVEHREVEAQTVSVECDAPVFARRLIGNMIEIGGWNNTPAAVDANGTRSCEAAVAAACNEAPAAGGAEVPSRMQRYDAGWVVRVWCDGSVAGSTGEFA